MTPSITFKIQLVVVRHIVEVQYGDDLNIDKELKVEEILELEISTRECNETH